MADNPKLIERIESDFRAAFKAHDVGRVGVLRLLKSAIANAAIAARTAAKQTLDDADVETVVRAELKKLADALTDFSRAARADLMAATEAEIKVMKTYLPPELEPAALKATVAEAVATLKRAGAVDFGRAMKAVQAMVRGRASGEQVAAAVREEINRDTPS